jgi:hypothetical protein
MAEGVVRAGVKPARVMTLRRDGTCASCGLALAAGTRAQWDPDARTTACLACLGDGSVVADEPAAVDAPASEAPLADVAPTTREVAPAEEAPATAAEKIDMGHAGASAQREYERRRDKREASVRERHPRLGGLILALSDDPQSTKAWAVGAEGEREVARMLDTLRSESVIVLNDRRVPRSKANIDHVVIASGGVFVIDAKRYTGRVEIRGSGSIFRPGPNLLYVGGRNKTTLVEAMAKQVEVVRTQVEDVAPVPGDSDVPLIRPALCFVDAEWSLFAKPMKLQGVHISGPKALARWIQEPGSLTTEQVLALGSRLAERLAPA